MRQVESQLDATRHVGFGSYGSGYATRQGAASHLHAPGHTGRLSGCAKPTFAGHKTLGEGFALYQANCTSCHGATGMGDGEVAKSLSPSLALLAHMIQMPMSVDEYMLWSISDGGAAFGTALPAYKDVLTKDEIWKIVTYMRAGFPVEQKQQ